MHGAAPSLTEIGRLAAIAAIRTTLNFFLGREIAQERAEMAAGRPKEHASGPPRGQAPSVP
ncbi:hypothetical protein GCM10010358_58390 [Streptomyces minutiscleroticus]|uniref:DUF1622 domain-containing protein n=1 Tax=Streptomyces minutiscleroticus TaxID=68238 RepID=A0A918NUA1_9ACTN|nr:hypothetical protein GCM10010358_58390 [Streptomyces minutiscleroticus]